MSYRDALADVIANVIDPAAGEVDRAGRFPAEAMEALGKAGSLGLTASAEVGGGGKGLREAADAVERVARSCGSTAMVLQMHYAAAAVLEAHGPRSVREAVGAGRHLSTLAFSEAGSRSHFWAPTSSATADDGAGVLLNARKSWVTSAGHADSYVWSSRPLQADGPMTLWLVPSDAAGLSSPQRFDGLGLRGNASSPVTGESVRVGRDAMLGGDGAGLDIAFATALPYFLVLNAASNLGLMEAVIGQTVAHLTGTRLEHLGQTLAEQPGPRAGVARMRIAADLVRVLLSDVIAALEAGRPDAQLRLLEGKAVAAEAAIEVTDLAMTLCGGSAFRKELGIERRFRDARAARVMAPTTEALQDFIGRALCGLPLM
jgi:alkylation response protein AidB-like acyl-CoA dehydrogenase